MKSFSKHISHYLSLFGILAVATVGFIIFDYDKALKTSILVATAISYVSWGIIHHYLHRDLHLSVVLEYMLIASLGLTMALSLI